MNDDPGGNPGGNPGGTRYLCVGMGAIGTYIGGSLALVGEDVTFIERADVAARLNQIGLQIHKGGQDYTIPRPKIVSSFETAFSRNDYDLAILAVKSFDTASVLEAMKPFQDRFPSVLCLQNGVENEKAFVLTLGRKRVIPGTVVSAVGRAEVGNIIVEKLRGVGIAGGHPRSSGICAAFTRAGLKAKLYANPDAMKWSKLLTNLAGNATSAILNMSPGQIFNHPDLFRMEIEQLRETLRVMKALSIPVTDLPGTQVILFSIIVKYFPNSVSRKILNKSIAEGRGNKMPSFHIDLHSGRGKTEVDYLNGAVARFGGKAGVPTPVNALLSSLLQELASGVELTEKFDQKPEQLMALWERNCAPGNE
jgi:2-dehydropantoate 2-reductase